MSIFIPGMDACTQISPEGHTGETDSPSMFGYEIEIDDRYGALNIDMFLVREGTNGVVTCWSFDFFNRSSRRVDCLGVDVSYMHRGHHVMLGRS